MKRVGLLLILVCLLPGCTGGTTELERGMALRARLLQASGCSFDAAITADYGDRLYEFSMACAADTLGDLTFTVTAPDTIAGITGSIHDEGGKLTFGETALQFDLLAEDQITPVSAPWILIKTLRSGYITSTVVEEERLRLSIDDSYDDDALHLDIWLDEADLPVRAEILYDDRRILSLNITNFTIS